MAQAPRLRPKSMPSKKPTTHESLRIPASRVEVDVIAVRRSERVAKRRAVLCERASEAPEPPVGAHLVTPRRGYTHHGNYAGDGSVLHYARSLVPSSAGPSRTVKNHFPGSGQILVLVDRMQHGPNVVSAPPAI